MESNKIHIFGWRIGARTMAAVAELRSSTALGNLGAKNAIYDVVGGVSIDVPLLQGVDPVVLAARLREFGFVASTQPPIPGETAARNLFHADQDSQVEAAEAVAVG